MASESRQPQSGLKTVKRDWSELSQGNEESIPWDPTPPKKPLTGVERRLKSIQDALAGKPAALTNASSQVNRGAATSRVEGNQPPNKRRSLPSNEKGIMKTPAQTEVLTSSTDWSSSTSPSASKSSHLTPSSTSKSATRPATVFLSAEQTQIKKLVEEGQSVFYTGSAGTGKSVLLREIIKTLRKKHVKSPDAVAVTASTGIAACNIGGVTIHSFAGVGLGIESAEDLANKVKKNKKASTRWLRTKVLIIDEVSMLDGDLFDKLSRVGSILRKRVDPFGGIQVIVTGDFFQLPPVTKNSASVKFAFEAAVWSQTIKRTFNLTKVFRQSDQEFVNMLNEMRFGRLSPKSIVKFRSLQRDIIYEDGLGATELFPRREDVERSNTIRIRNLQTEEFTYKARDGGTIQDLKQREKMLANFMAPDSLTLRVDAQVMLIKNVDETLVNGSMGRVIKFCDPASYATELDDVTTIGGSKTAAGAAASKAKSGNQLPVVEFMIGRSGTRTVIVTEETWKAELPNGEVQASRTQIPLVLSWAMSIHKSQGQTLERVKVDLGKVFEKGQAYVALSRATSLDGLQVLNFDPTKVKAHPKVVAWSKTLETVS